MEGPLRALVFNKLRAASPRSRCRVRRTAPGPFLRALCRVFVNYVGRFFSKTLSKRPSTRQEDPPEHCAAPVARRL